MHSGRAFKIMHLLFIKQNLFIENTKVIINFVYFPFFNLVVNFLIVSIFSTAKPSATSATLELDKLMASLSDFRVQSTVSIQRYSYFYVLSQLPEAKRPQHKLH